MLRLDRVIKPWKESAALNAHINLYGFWNDTTFLTKSGDVGMVLCTRRNHPHTSRRERTGQALQNEALVITSLKPSVSTSFSFSAQRPARPSLG